MSQPSSAVSGDTIEEEWKSSLDADANGPPLPLLICHPARPCPIMVRSAHPRVAPNARVDEHNRTQLSVVHSFTHIITARRVLAVNRQIILSYQISSCGIIGQFDQTHSALPITQCDAAQSDDEIGVTQQVAHYQTRNHSPTLIMSGAPVYCM